MGLFDRNKKTEEKTTKPVFRAYVDNSLKTVKEKFKGEVVKNDIKFPQQLGEEHPFDYKEVEGLYKTFGMVTGVVDKYVDFIVGPGFYVKSEDERAQAICEQFIKDVDFDTVLRPWIKESLVKGTGFLELGGQRDQQVNGLKVLDSKYMYIDRDDTGEIQNYKQFIGNAERFNPKDMSKVTTFEPYQIAHFSINKIGDCEYGQGIIQPAKKTINNLLGLQKDMHTLMKRKANVPIVVQMGDSENQPAPGDIEAFGKDLEWLNNKHEWTVPYYVDMKALDFGKVGDKFEIPLQYDLDMLFFAFQVPEVLMGRGNIPEGLAKVQLEAFQRRVQSIQSEIEKVIEQKIFKRLLNAQGIDTHVEFEWGQPSDSEKNERITKITTILQNMQLGSKFRGQLELELARLLGINPELIESDEEQREQEREQQQPEVPGSNRESYTITNSSSGKRIFIDNPSTHVHENLEHFNSAPLKEWLDFNYEEYLGFILSAIDTDKFENLRGLTLEDFDRGKFNDKQVDALRGVLKDGFKQNKNLNEIADDVEKKVGVSDLFNEEGRLLATAQTRKFNIARTESTRLAAEGSIKNYDDKGIKQYSWVASLGDRTCPICEGLNGKIFELYNGPRPPAHGGCRCTVVPLTRNQ